MSAVKDPSAIDQILNDAVESGAVPHVVAIAADRDGVIYQGAAGPRTGRRATTSSSSGPRCAAASWTAPGSCSRRPWTRRSGPDRRPGLPGRDRHRRPGLQRPIRPRAGTPFWADRTSGVCASIYSNFLPFITAEALALYAGFEEALYAAL